MVFATVISVSSHPFPIILVVLATSVQTFILFTWVFWNIVPMWFFLSLFPLRGGQFTPDRDFQWINRPTEIWFGSTSEHHPCGPRREGPPMSRLWSWNINPSWEKISTSRRSTKSGERGEWWFTPVRSESKIFIVDLPQITNNHPKQCRTESEVLNYYETYQQVPKGHHARAWSFPSFSRDLANIVTLGQSVDENHYSYAVHIHLSAGSRIHIYPVRNNKLLQIFLIWVSTHFSICWFSNHHLEIILQWWAERNDKMWFGFVLIMFSNRSGISPWSMS
jgi:hypothetical protein